jgi:short subunit dehydrogenase-like uncharacterized protein
VACFVLVTGGKRCLRADGLKGIRVVILSLVRRQVVRALKRRSGALRWAVAGRDAAGLRALGAPAEPIVADAADQASLDAMAAQAKVVVDLAGPYARHGEAVVVACINYGAHYLDLTGETFGCDGRLPPRAPALSVIP